MHDSPCDILFAIVTVAILLGGRYIAKWTATKGNTTGFRLGFTFGPDLGIVALFFGLWLTGCSGDEASAIEDGGPCNEHEEFAEFASNLTALGQVKEMCSHIYDAGQYPACGSSPLLLSVNFPLRECKYVRRENIGLSKWLGEFTPPLEATCRKDDVCRPWAINFGRISANPPE